MSASLARVFAAISATRLRAEENARTKLADALTDMAQGIDTGQVRTAMQAAALGRLIRQVNERAEKVGIREAIDSMRQDLTRQLLTRSPGSSTCEIRNAAGRMDVEAAQAFLADTDGLLENFEKEADTKEATPEPTPVDTPKATPAQKRTLEAIRDNGVKLRLRLDGRRSEVDVARGTKPRRDMVEWVIKQGWAEQDNTELLLKGQPVRLTAIGEAILAS